MWRRRNLMAELEAKEQEIQLMREENARLRLERQMPLSPGATAGRARALLDTIPQPDPTSVAEDAAAGALAEAHMIRASLQAVCEDLETTIGQLRRRLQSGTPTTELDRRVRDRRRSDRVANEVRSNSSVAS